MVMLATYTVVGDKAYVRLESFINDKKTLTQVAGKLAEQASVEKVKFTKHLPSGYPVTSVVLELPESESEA